MALKTGNRSRKRTSKPHFISLRAACAMVMNPENPDAAYAEMDASVNRMARIFQMSWHTSLITLFLSILSAAAAAYYCYAGGKVPLFVIAVGALFLILAILSHPLTLNKTVIGKLILPKEPEAMRDLLNRLARGEFAAHMGDDNHAMVNIEDVRTVIADRRADRLLPTEIARRQSIAANRRIKDISRKLPLEPMRSDAELVDPETIDELNKCASGAMLKLNTAYAIILGHGDATKGAALLRQLERQSNTVIRQPGSQYIQVGGFRAFLKEQRIPGVITAPWDGMR
jgi:hypothetical protein